MTLPLDTWRQIIGYHPLHFWQLANSRTPITSACNGLVREYAWQSVDAAGRTEVRAAIVTAEERLREYLGYAPMPTAATETIAWPHLWDAWLRRTNGVAPDGRAVPLQLASGYVQAVGYDTRTLIGTPAVVYTDTDGDGINDTFTASIATSVTDASQIEAHVAAADRLDGAALSDASRIAPAKVTIAAGIVTVTGRAWLCVKPILYQSFLPVPSAGAADQSSGALDPSSAAVFVNAIDIVQHTTDPNGTTTDTSQAVLIWETQPCAGAWCCDTLSTASYSPSAFDPAAQAFAVARVGIRDAVNGLITPAEAVRDAATGLWTQTRFDTCAAPDRVTVRYRAGYPLGSDGQMAATLRPVVARLAAAELSRPIAACDDANRELYRWQLDLARGGGKSIEQFSISPRDLDNPLGTRAGHVQAWKYIQNNGLASGFTPG